MQCIKVTKQTPVITSKVITQYQAQLPGWKVRTKEGEQRLVKKFAFKDFKQAITFTNKIGSLANEEDHHPADPDGVGECDPGLVDAFGPRVVDQ